MPKIDVILTHSVTNLGAESDHVKVAAGFARNYLFPQGYAIPLTGANKRRVEALRQRRLARESRELESMSELGQSLSKLLLVIKVKTGDDGKMYGSVTGGTIVDELKTQFEAIVDKRKVHLPAPIKKLGEHQVEMRLHADVVSSLKVRVESLDPAVNTAIAAAENASAKPASRQAAPVEAKETEKKAERPARKPAAAKKEKPAKGA